MRIADLLSHGQENAVPLRQLMAITGEDGRTIRGKIATERERFVRSMRHRAQEIERAAEAIERAGGDGNGHSSGIEIF